MDLPQLISRGRPCHEDNMTDDTCCWKKRFHWQWHCSNLSSSQQLILSDILKTERLWNNEQIWWQARGQDGWKYHAADHCQLKAANRLMSSFGINSKLSVYYTPSCTILHHLAPSCTILHHLALSGTILQWCPVVPMVYIMLRSYEGGIGDCRSWL